MEQTAFPLQQLDFRAEGEDAVFRVSETAYKLNPVGRVIWESVVEPVALSEVRRRVSETFDVAPDECAAAVDAFIERLRGLDLVDVIEEDGSVAALRRRYLTLLKRALVNLIYPEHDLRVDLLESEGKGPDRTAYQRRMRDIRYTEAETYARLVDYKTQGLNWHGKVMRFSHTMIGLRRLDNLDYCAASVFANGVPGDFLEAGVCQGGAAIFLRALQVIHGQSQRRTWVADSFRGLPPPSIGIDVDLNMDFSESLQPWLAVSADAVRDNFRTYDLLSENVRFIEGWFSESLPAAPVEQLAILRVDADLYESTRDVLDALYDRVSPGGFVIVDDYHAFEPCRVAVDEFRARRAIAAPLRRVDWTAVYWQKTR